ncbi:MAG: DUF4258 domain-containing protein [Acidobacteriota bacterium]
MPKIVPFEDPTNYWRAIKRIRKLWQEGNVTWIPHAEEQMRVRGIDLTDVAHLIRYGRIVNHSRPVELWRYEIKGKMVDGGQAKCVVEIDGALIIITLFELV